MSGIRQQFSIEENIRLSSYSMEFLRDIGTLLHIPGEDPPDVQFVEQGYLILSSEQGAAVAEENHKIQRLCSLCVFYHDHVTVVNAGSVECVLTCYQPIS